MNPFSSHAKVRGMRGPLLLVVALVIGFWVAIFIGHRDQDESLAPRPSILQPFQWVPQNKDAVIDNTVASLVHDHALSHEKRLNLVRALPGNTTESDLNALLGLLVVPRGANQLEGEFSEIFHELVVVLRRDKENAEPLSRVLATVAADSKQDLVVRDYAIQHLRTIWDGADPNLRTGIEGTFLQLLHGEEALAGSALLSLHLLGAPSGRANAPHIGGVFPDGKLIASIRPILARQPVASDTGLRMVAIRVAGERGLREFAPKMRDIASGNNGDHVLVRMAAISALGRFDDPHDDRFLSGINSTDPRIKSAIDYALAGNKSR